MKIQFFCPIWGLVPDYIHKIEGPLEKVLLKIAASGYDGVEMSVPEDPRQKKTLYRLLEKSGLAIIALQWAANGNNFEQYLSSYEKCLISAADVSPRFINCHSGKDHFSYEENCAVIEKSVELEKTLGIKIIHETHRGRFTFHSKGIQQYLSAYPDLKLAADFSHWCAVSESFLQDQKENMQNAINRAEHIHARVGHPQSPQVNDPRSPEWEEALNYHLTWWDAIIKVQVLRGVKRFSITPEFGPPNYMPTFPYSRQPLASQWHINLWIKDLLKSRYLNEGENSIL